MSWPKPTLKDPRFRGWLAVGILGLLVLALLWPLAVGRDARVLSAFGSGKDDLSQFHDELASTGAPVTAIFSTTNLLHDTDPSKTLLVIVGTERPYDPGEAQAVKDFLRAGGNVVLADDTGYGIDITRDAVGFAITSKHILDTVNDRNDVTHPVAMARLDGQQYRLIFNVASALQPLSNAAPHDTIASSSAPVFPNGSYLDTNDNGVIEIGDSPGPFPLIIRAQPTSGGGTLVVISDSGVFQNQQMGLADYDNARFARALATSLVPSGGSIVLDESRHPPSFFLAPWENSVRALGRVATGALTPYLLVAALVLASVGAWALTRQTEDWSHHAFDASQVLPAPETLRADHARAQRMARHRISERYNIPLEQVAAMTTEELLAVTHDKALSDAASGALRGDPTPLFVSFSKPPES